MSLSITACAGTTPQSAATLASAPTRLHEFSAFKLGAEEYGIAILCVQTPGRPIRGHLS